MTPEEIKRLREVGKAATEGPWRAVAHDTSRGGSTLWLIGGKSIDHGDGIKTVPTVIDGADSEDGSPERKSYDRRRWIFRDAFIRLLYGAFMGGSGLAG